MIETLNSWAAMWSDWALASLVEGAVLLAVVGAVWRIAARRASAQFGYPTGLLSTIGIILLVCLVIYVVPRTSVLGALLITGYLGGAVEANLRIGTPLFSNALFPVYFAVLVWGGLFLREQRVRDFFSFRKPQYR